MTKSTITRERVVALIAEHSYDSALVDALEHLLAAMDSEPVAVIDLANLDYLLSGADADVWPPEREEMGDVLLYRHAQPAPVVPNGLRLALSNAGIAAPESDEMLAATCEKHIQALVTWVKDRKPFQSAPVVPDDVLAALQKVARIRLDMNDFDGDRRGIADCLCDAEEALIEVVNRRAAMFNHPEQHLDMVDHSGDVNEKGGDGNSPVIPDGWTCNDKANAALMMLDRIETVDPVDDDRIDGIKRIVRELAAATQSPGSDPATVPGKWIPVSERMPEDEQEVLTINRMGHRFVSFFDKHSGLYFDRLDAPAACCIERVLVTHWMPLPAAPQEVKGE